MASPPQTSPRRKKSSPSRSRVRRRCSCQKSWVDVLDGVEAEAVEAHPLGEPEVGLDQVVADLGQLGLEVGQAGDAAGEVVVAAGPGLSMRSQPRVAGSVM